MLELVYCLIRKPSVAPAEFHRYWLEQLAPKVRERKAALGAQRYVQSHALQPGLNALLQQSRGMQPPYDGITEVWWNDVSDLEQALATEQGRRAMQELLDDESTFIDFANSRLFCTQEHVF